MTTIHATGVGEQHYRAERATITALISIASTNRDSSIEQATRLHNQLVQRAKDLRSSGDATWHSAAPLSTWIRKSYAEGSKQTVVIEHVTSSRVRVKLSNLELVSKVVAELADLGAETNVEWALTEASKRAHQRTARKLAVASSREVADDYAAALGERVVKVVSISDQQHYGGAQMRSASASMGGGAEVTIAEITVSASVEGVFESVK